MKRSKILLIPSLLSLSPNLLLIASTKLSKSIPPFFAASGVSRSAISWKIVGFFESNPKDCIAALSSFGSIFPVPFVSNKSKACLISSTSSVESPGRSTFFATFFVPCLDMIIYIIYYIVYILIVITNIHQRYSFN